MTTPDINILSNIVDLNRYPIHNLDSNEGRALVESSRKLFTDSVSCLLPGFLNPSAVDRALSEILPLEERANLSDRYRSPYGVYNPVHDENVDLDSDSPHFTPQKRKVHYLAYNELTESSVIHQLYTSPELTRFAAAILGIDTLYPTDDPMMAAPVTFHYAGCELGWHCDTQEFTITIMLRPSEQGGKFQYFPEAGPRDKNFDLVPEVLEGEVNNVRTVPFEAGGILLFRGANTLHRVTRTEGTSPRILSVFHYERTPGRMYDADWKQVVFGKTT